MAQDAPTTGVITPYLPPDAMAIARAHYGSNKQPAFTWTVSMGEEGECPNCGGNGEVYLRLAERGPFGYVPTTKKVITFFDGDGVFGKGYYIVKETLGFVCPECKGVRFVPRSPMAPRGER